LDGGIYNYNSKISKLNYSFEDFFFLWFWWLFLWNGWLII
jgi:hypothetical protein